MIEVTKENFEVEVLRNELPVIVDFWGPKCTKCLALMPDVEKLEAEYGDRVKFCKLNIQGNRRVAISLKVMGLPAFLLFHEGEEKTRLGGEAVTIGQIRAMLDEVVTG